MTLDSDPAGLEGVLAAFDEQVMLGLAPDTDAFCLQHPQFRELRRHLDVLRGLRQQLPRAASGAEAPVSLVGQPFGDFTLLRLLGRGGMGDVYVARQQTPQRLCAVKVMTSLGAASLRRFQREAAVMARLDHPHIAAVYGAGEQAAWAYLALQLVSGVSLRRLLLHADAASQGGDWLLEVLRAAAGGDAVGPAASATPMPSAIANGLMYQTATALAHAHDRGLLHRDIKPANLMVTLLGQVKVIDFGIAVAWHDDGEPLTADGAFVGSFDYAAPEQLRGERAALGPWTDTYALGVTLFELLTQRLPYPCAGYAERLALAAQPLPMGPRQLNGSVPRQLDALVRKALAVDPQQRFADGAEMADALAPGRASAVSVTVPGGLLAGPAWRRRWPWVIWLVSCLGLLFWGMGERQRHQHDATSWARDLQFRDRSVADKVLQRNQAAFERCVESAKKPGKYVPPLLQPRFEARLGIRDERVAWVQVSSFSCNINSAAKGCMTDVVKTLEFPGVGLGQLQAVDVSLLLPNTY